MELSNQQHISVLVLLTICATAQGLRLLSLPRLPPATEAEILEAALGADTPDTYILKKRGSQGSGVWFGPRLGRREKRSADVMEEGEESRGEGIVELLKEAPWALVPLKGHHRHTLNFTPRLGRDSAEEQDPEDDVVYEQRSPPFAPRLGRRLIPFAPRLGRQGYTPRLGRSIASPMPPTKNH